MLTTAIVVYCTTTVLSISHLLTHNTCLLLIIQAYCSFKVHEHPSQAAHYNVTYTFE